MTPRYFVGQRVIIKPIGSGKTSLRDVALESYAGQTGKISNYYSLSMDMGKEVFYLYTVVMDQDKKEIVANEDELRTVVE
jgi:hypothetical protein